MTKNISDTYNVVDIDKNKDGKLTISPQAVQKLIYGLLVSENYQVNLNEIKIINDRDNANLEARIKLLVNHSSNLLMLKQKVINLISERITSILNINLINISLIFNADN